MLIKLILFIFHLSTLQCYSYKSNAEKKDLTEFEIESEIIPKRYDIKIKLQPDGSLNEFDAEIKISFLSKKSSTVLNINTQLCSDQLERILLINKNTTKIVNNFDYQKNEGTVLRLRSYNSTILNKNNQYELVLRYTSSFIDSSFYRNDYTADDGSKRQYAITIFNKDIPKFVVPCFKSVSKKVNFKLRVAHPNNVTVLSNMLGEVTTRNGNSVITSFKETPKIMCSAFSIVICDFITTSTSLDDELSLNIHSINIPTNIVQLSSVTSINILRELNSLLNYSFPLKKLDLIVFPNFSYDIINNLGIICFGNEDFIYNPKHDSILQLQKVVYNLAQQLTKQMFRSLVESNDCYFDWLSEGFSNYIAYNALDKVFPNEKYLERLIVDLQLLKNSDELLDFKSIKATSLIHMLINISPEQNVNDIIYFYVTNCQKKPSLENFTENDNENDEILFGNIDIFRFIISWMAKPSYPILKVVREYETNNFYLFQEPFEHESNTSTTWSIPYNYASKSYSNFKNTNPIGLLKENFATINLYVNKEDWVIFNIQQSGYFMVNYDTPNWRLIIKELVHGNINIVHPTNRAQLLHSSYILALKHKLIWDIPLKLFSYLNRETNPIPWMTADGILREIENRYVVESENEKLLNAIVLNATINLYHQYGTIPILNEPTINHHTRLIGIRWTCKYNYPDCLNEFELKSQSIGSSILENENLSIDADILHFTYCYGFQNEENFEKLWWHLLAHEDYNRKQQFFSQLHCHQNKKIFRKYYVQFYLDMPKKDLPKINEDVQLLLLQSFDKINSNILANVIKNCIIEHCYEYEDDDNLKETIQLMVDEMRHLESVTNLGNEEILRQFQDLEDTAKFLEYKMENKFIDKFIAYGNEVLKQNLTHYLRMR